MPEPHLSEIWRNWALVGAAGLGVVVAFWRGFVADRQSRASRSQADTAQRTHNTEVFREAVGQLSHDRLEIRLGAIFTLQQIGKDNPEFDHYVIQVLTAYVRERSSGADPNDESDRDIREILDFLRQKYSKED